MKWLSFFAVLFGLLVPPLVGQTAEDEKPKPRATLEGHTQNGICSVAFSPDGQTLASGGDDNTVRLWDVATGKTTATLQQPMRPTESLKGVDGVAFSPDGKTLASVGAAVVIWDIATGKHTSTINGKSFAAFSPDSKVLASRTVTRDKIVLWDVASGKAVTTLERHKSVSCVAFSPDGKTLASGSDSDRTVKLWDVATAKNTATLQGHTEEVRTVAFSPDGKTLASGSGSRDGSIRLWDVATGKNTATFYGHSKGVLSVAFSPDGKTLASGGGDKGVRLWDIQAHQPKEDEGKAVQRLTNKEETLLRKLVYEEGLGTSIPPKGPYAGHRILVVSNSLIALHKKKRVATLRLLLDVVKGGRPNDVVTAAGFAVAVEEGPIEAEVFANYPLDMVDNNPKEPEPSGRQRLIESLEQMLTKAEKQHGAEK